MAIDLTKIGTTTSVSNFLAPTATPTTLTTQNTKPTQAISVTPKPDNTNYAGILANAQQQALSIQQGIANLAQQQTQQQPQSQTNPNSAMPGQQSNPVIDYINSIQGLQNSTPTNTQSFKDAYSQSGLTEQQNAINEKAKITNEAQGRLNNISAQLQALNAEATAVPIQLQQDSTGRGRTEGGVAPLQADKLREIALRAIPLQAQAYVTEAEVATAQGNQKLAQDLYNQASDRFDKLFTLQMQDVQRQYEFKTGIIDKVFTYATNEQKNILEAQKQKAQNDFTTSERLARQEFELNMAKTKATTQTGGGVLSSLPVSIQGKVISAAEGFGTSDIVKKFNSVVDSINVVNGIDASSTNPADHQAIVYAFAKALDPDSAVKEGEYDTIKKYAQSAVSKYGKEISNAINGTGFLSEGAIKNIQTTMNNLYTSRKSQYDSAYSERARTINNIAGAEVAGEILRDYSQGVSVPEISKEEDIYSSVVGGGEQESSSWISNLWNKLF